MSLSKPSKRAKIEPAQAVMPQAVMPQAEMPRVSYFRWSQPGLQHFLDFVLAAHRHRLRLRRVFSENPLREHRVETVRAYPLRDQVMLAIDPETLEPGLVHFEAVICISTALPAAMHDGEKFVGDKYELPADELRAAAHSAVTPWYRRLDRATKHALLPELIRIVADYWIGPLDQFL